MPFGGPRFSSSLYTADKANSSRETYTSLLHRSKTTEPNIDTAVHLSAHPPQLLRPPTGQIIHRRLRDLRALQVKVHGEEVYRLAPVRQGAAGSALGAAVACDGRTIAYISLM